MSVSTITDRKMHICLLEKFSVNMGGGELSTFFSLALERILAETKLFCIFFFVMRLVAAICARIAPKKRDEFIDDGTSPKLNNLLSEWAKIYIGKCSNYSMARCCITFKIFIHIFRKGFRLQMWATWPVKTCFQARTK